MITSVNIVNAWPLFDDSEILTVGENILFLSCHSVDHSGVWQGIFRAITHIWMVGYGNTDNSRSVCTCHGERI
jgi:hypothetical protein